MPETIPKLHVQRVGKKWRIVYYETRNVAKFVNGEPVDGGGFADEWNVDEEGKRIRISGEGAARIRMEQAKSGATENDPEEENVG